MTTDERIDRLVERHEALAESVQSLFASVNDLRRITENNQQMIVSVARNMDIFREEMHQVITGLVGIANNHEARIIDLEEAS